jgi:hypothetical protein
MPDFVCALGLLSRKQRGDIAIADDAHLVPRQLKQVAVIIGSSGLPQVALVTLHMLGKLIRGHAKQDFEELDRAVRMGGTFDVW